MKKSSVILFLLIFGLSVYAQLRIIDRATDEPIAFAHLILGEGKLGASSNIKGEVSLSKLERKIRNVNDTIITIQHLGYENFEIGIQTLRQLSVIRLEKRDIVLSEVIIAPEKKYDYLVLKGFYRSYHIEDDNLKYYTDGIVEYYIPRGKYKLNFRLLEHRSFRNKILIDKEKKRVITVGEILARIPDINGKTVFDEINSDYIFNESEILKKGEKVGYIKNDTVQNIFQVNIDKILPEKEKKRSLFGYTGRLTNEEITENYFTNDISGVKIDQLESCKKYQKLYFSYTKAPEEILMEGITEFYVIEKQYVNKDQLKGIKMKSDVSLPKSTTYSYEYWNEMNQFGIPPLSRQIESELVKSLIRY